MKQEIKRMNSLTTNEWEKMIKEKSCEIKRKAFIIPNGLREYQIINSTIDSDRVLKIDVLVRDDDDFPKMYYPKFDTNKKIAYCDGLAHEIVEVILRFDFIGIYGIPILFRK